MSLALANGVAKLVGGIVEELQPKKAMLDNRFSKAKAKQVGDRGFELPIVTALPFNFGHPSEGGDMPIGSSVETDRAMVFAKRMVVPIRLTGKSLQVLRTGKGEFSYSKAWGEMNLSAAVETGYMIDSWLGYGTGNGKLATISSGASSATQTVSNNDADRYLRKGMRISIIDPTLTTVRGSAVITSDSGTGATTFTIDSSISSTTSDLVVIQNGANQAPTGLGHIVDDTTFGGVVFQNINRSSLVRYRAQLLTGSSGLVSHDLLHQMLEAKIFPQMLDLNRDEYELWTHPAQSTAYQQLGWNKKTFEGKTKSIDLGFLTYEFEGIPWVIDPQAPKTDIWFLKWSDLYRFETLPWEWDEQSGSIWNRVPSDTANVAYKDLFEAYRVRIKNYGCSNPQAQGRIHTLAVPSGY